MIKIKVTKKHLDKIKEKGLNHENLLRDAN